MTFNLYNKRLKEQTNSQGRFLFLHENEILYDAHFQLQPLYCLQIYDQRGKNVN